MPVFKRQPKTTLRTVINELVDRSNTNTKRLRVLEQENEILKTRVNSLEKGILDQKKEINKLVADLNNKLTKMDQKIVKLERTAKQMINEIKKLVSTAKIKELEDLIQIYSPLKSKFITREELERILEEKKGGNQINK